MSTTPAPQDSGAVKAGAAPAEATARLTVRKPLRSVVGIVTSAKMQKTISVESDRIEKHVKYGKFLKRRVRYKVHDEKGEAKEGDQVRIVQTRPLSKTKRWRLVEIVSRARR